MNENKLHKLFAAARNEAPPSVPDDFARGVLREIQPVPHYSMWDQLAALFPKLASVSLLVIALSLAANFYFIEDDSVAGDLNQMTDQWILSADNAQ